MKIGIFGGSFNPPHIGHLMACQYVFAVYDIDSIWVVPTQKHPFDKSLLDFWHRYELCVKTFKKDSRFDIMNFPHTHTIDLLEKEIISKFDHSFSLIIGFDIINEWHKWKDYHKIEELVPIIRVPRGSLGYQSLPDISSTEIRELLKAKQDISNMKLMTQEALAYLTHNKLEF